MVMLLLEAFRYQGYEVFCDDYYSSPSLFQVLLECGIYATGTLRVDRKDVPEDVKTLKVALTGSKVYVEPATIFVRETSTPVGEIAAPFLPCPWPTQGMHQTPKLQGE